jgi:transposase
MKFCGIDLHSNNCVVAVIDESDRVLYRRRLSNDLERVVSALTPYRDELAGVVVESTFNWYWLVDGLQAAGFVVHLANTTALKCYEGLKHSDDDTDAVYLAQVLRLGILPTGYICPPPARALRDLARKRMQLVRTRTAQVLSVENIVSRQCGHGLSGNAVKRLDAAGVQALGLPERVTQAVAANVAVIEVLNTQIAQLEGQLHTELKANAAYLLLLTVPGIGQTLATVIALELGTVQRFKSVGAFASYARCVDSRRLSNGKQKGTGNVRNGNKYLGWAFVEAAQHARRFCPQAQRFYERKKAATNTVVATKALAHKLARACYHMLDTQRPFEVGRCFGGGD